MQKHGFSNTFDYNYQYSVILQDSTDYPPLHKNKQIFLLYKINIHKGCSKFAMKNENYNWYTGYLIKNH